MSDISTDDDFDEDEMFAVVLESVTSSPAPAQPVVTLGGNSSNSYFRLHLGDARRLGLAPSPSTPCALQLMPGFDGAAMLLLPTGRTFTAIELTQLAHKAGNLDRGWEIWTDDPLGYPSVVQQ